MTDPIQAKTVKMGAYETTRKYSWPPLPPHEFTVTSVTSAIKHGLPKPFLVGWAAKVVAEAAVTDHEIVNLMLKKQGGIGKKEAIAHLKGARYRGTSAKADRGNVVHSAMDAYLSGNPWTEEQIQAKIEELEVPQSMWLSTKGMIQGAMNFLFDTEPEVYHNEGTVYSRKHGYAGTADIICTLGIGQGRYPVVVDFKTSPRIYDEVALQLAAYARADFVGHNDGSEGALVPSGDPIQYGVVVRPKADGTYERGDFTLSDDVFNLFLSILGTAEATEANILGKARRPTVQ